MGRTHGCTRRCSSLTKAKGAVHTRLYGRDTFSGHQIEFVNELTKGSQAVTRAELSEWEQGILAKAEAVEFFFSLNRYIFNVAKLQKSIILAGDQDLPSRL
jgi:hypothetical protein